MASQRPSAEQVRLAVLLTVLVIVSVVAGLRMIGEGGLVGPGERRSGAEYEARDLPRLAQIRGWDDSEAQSITSRNPFTFGAPPTPTRNLTPPPTRPPIPTRPPRPTATPRIYRDPYGNSLGPPPPFEREYIGFFGPDHRKVAAFRREGDGPEIIEIDVGFEGEILDDVFIIRKIGLESVQIGFVGYDISEDTRVPLADD
jgi:hypothetical protein